MTARAGRIAVPGALGALMCALPFVMDDRFLLKILTLVGVNVIIVAGLALLFGFGGQVSIGHAAFYGLGAYTSATLVTLAGWPWALSAVAGVVLSAAAGLLLAVPSLRLRGHYLAMATLGFGEIMVVFFREMRDVTGGPDGMRVPDAVVGSFTLGASDGSLTMSGPGDNYLIVWIVAVLTLLLVAGIVRRRPGRALLALHGSEAGALACGVDVAREKIKVFTLSAGLAGLAGVLYAQAVNFISPSTFSLHHSIVLLAMVVIGGTGSLAGAVTAAVVLTLLPFLDAIVPGVPREVAVVIQDWEADVYGLAIILVMLFLPGGLASGVRGLFGRLARGGGDAS